MASRSPHWYSLIIHACITLSRCRAFTGMCSISETCARMATAMGIHHHANFRGNLTLVPRRDFLLLADFTELSTLIKSF
ncbi:hypothetical protein F5B20DRAFT_551607, partial [Whalleya microplaca]